MSDIAKISIEQYDRMINAGVFEPKENHPRELIEGEIRNWEGPATFSIADYDRMLESGVFDFPEKQRVELVQGKLRMMSPINPAHESSLDLLTKWSCKSEGIEDYWVANIVDQVVEVFRDPKNGRYQQRQTYGVGETISVLAFPQNSLNIAETFPAK